MTEISPIFLDEAQHGLKLPLDIWCIILELITDHDSFREASFRACSNMLICVSKAFNIITHDLNRRFNIKTRHSCSSYFCKNGFVSCLKYAVQLGANIDTIGLELAASGGHISCLQFAVDQEISIPNSALDLAARGGHLETVKFLRTSCSYTQQTLKGAIESGNLELVKYLVDNDCPWSDQFYCRAAAATGVVPLFQFIHETMHSSFVKSHVLQAAAENGHVTMLKHLLDLGMHLREGYLVCQLAMANGHIEVVRFAHSLGLPLEESVMTAASKFGNFEFVKELHEMGCRWNAITLAHVAALGDLDNVKYLIERGCPYDYNACREAAKIGSVEILKYLRNLGCDWDASTIYFAATNDHLECLKYAFENGAPCPGTIIDSCASAVNSISCVKYLHEQGYQWDEGTIAKAALNGKLFMVQFLHENECPWNEDTCTAALTGDNLPCLKYAHENGCPWDEETIKNAPSMACLQYAHENGCSWPDTICSYYAHMGNLEMLRYAHEHGARWTEDTCLRAIESLYGTVDCVRYAYENGASWTSVRTRYGYRDLAAYIKHANKIL